MKSQSTPTVTKPCYRHYRRYRRVKIWKAQTTIGEFCLYAVTADEARKEFKRLRPMETIISLTRTK